jgi:hypothetical protein
MEGKVYQHARNAFKWRVGQMQVPISVKNQLQIFPRVLMLMKNKRMVIIMLTKSK